MTTLLRREPPTCDAHDQSVFERLVKRYYHAKFWASNSKIVRVMANGMHVFIIILSILSGGNQVIEKKVIENFKK